MSSWAQVERFVLGLPETVVEPSYGGHPALRVNRLLLGRLRFESAEDIDPTTGAPNGEVLMLKVADLGEKEALLASDPAVYFTTPHYDGHAAVLVRLRAVDDRELEELLVEAWRARAPRRALVRYVDQGGVLPGVKGAGNPRRGSSAG